MFGEGAVGRGDVAEDPTECFLGRKPGAAGAGRLGGTAHRAGVVPTRARAGKR